MQDTIIVTVAPTGQWPTKADNAAVPTTPKEIADDVVRCWRAGASVAHLHMRDEAGLGSLCIERYRETVNRIKDACNIVINLTTAGQRGASLEERVRPVRALCPEMASFDCGSMNWGRAGVFLNTPEFLESLARAMLDCGTKPEVEIFDSGMMSNAQVYVDAGLLRTPLHYQFVLGVQGGMEATQENLLFLKQRLPAGSTWSALGIGRGHLPILLSSVAMGGHVRVGLEDNLVYAKGVPATNVSLVERAVRVIHEANKVAATPAEARTLLGLDPQ